MIYRNRNVLTIVVTSIFNSFAFSVLWFSTTWLVYGLGGSNTDLGRILGVTSLLSIFSSLVASYLADRYRKDVIIIFGGYIGLVGVFIISTAETISAIFWGQLLWSIGMWAAQPALTAILSNSLTSEKRTKVLGTMFLLSEGSSAIGGVLGYFVYQGASADNISTLNVSLIRDMIFIGFISYSIVVGLHSFLLRDKYSIDSDKEGSVSTRENDEFTTDSFSIIAYSLLSAFIVGFGAGISIPYFPRFFFDIYGIDLASLSLLMAGVSIITAIWGKFNANIAGRTGHVKIIIMNQLISVTLLYALATYPPLFFALGALIIRNAVMNGVGSVATSILMEYSPRNYRSKINAANTISWQLLFSVGNIIGGVIVDMYGFRLPIVLTATLYLFATLIYLKVGQLMGSDMVISSRVLV